MSDEGVTLDPQGASNALAAWDSAAGTLQQKLMAAAANALAALGNGEWIGDDEAGELFRNNVNPIDLHQFYGTGGPASSDVAGTGQATTAATVLGDVAGLGQNTRKAINNSLGSDDQQKQEMDKARKKMDGKKLDV